MAVKGGGIGAVRSKMEEEGGGPMGAMVGEGWGHQQCHSGGALWRVKAWSVVTGVRGGW